MSLNIRIKNLEFRIDNVASDESTIIFNRIDRRLLILEAIILPVFF